MQLGAEMFLHLLLLICSSKGENVFAPKCVVQFITGIKLDPTGCRNTCSIQLFACIFLSTLCKVLSLSRKLSVVLLLEMTDVK